MLGIVGGCTDAAAPGTRGTIGSAGGVFATSLGQGPQAETFDDLLAGVEADGPGFGGLYLNDAGELVIRSVAGSDHERVKSAVQRVFGRLPGRQGRPVHFEVASEPFSRLQSWMAAFVASGDFSGVLWSDIDERRGQLYFAVISDEAAVRVRSALSRNGVPSSAAAVERQPPMVHQIALNQTVQDASAPVVGGVRISTVVPGAVTIGQCTAGFNVTLPNDPTGLYLVTNSHCTSVEGSVSGDSIWQAAWGSAPHVQLAVEVLDIPYRTMPTSTGCPAGWNCRYVDGAVFRYANPAQGALGRIARPLWYAYASQPFTLVRDTADFHVTGDLPESWFIQGQWLSKVGMWTGWTAGKLDETCVTEFQSSISRAQLCQYIVKDFMNTPSLSNYGDSGSPVFFAYYSEDDVYGGFNWLAGILNGGTLPGDPPPAKFTFSSIHKLYEELGAMKTYPGPTCNPHPLLMGCL